MALGPNLRMACNPRRRIFKEFKNGSMSALAIMHQPRKVSHAWIK